MTAEHYTIYIEKLGQESLIFAPTLSPLLTLPLPSCVYIHYETQRGRDRMTCNIRLLLFFSCWVCLPYGNMDALRAGPTYLIPVHSHV